MYVLVADGVWWWAAMANSRLFDVGRVNGIVMCCLYGGSVWTIVYSLTLLYIGYA